MSRGAKTEAFIDSLPRADVYRFMQAEYRIISNHDNEQVEYNYIPEEHDDPVATKAAGKFSISSEEALEIYLQYELKITEYMGNNKGE